jgi:hypothetical protein
MSKKLPEDDDLIKQRLLDRPVTSLRDIQYTYGVLDDLVAPVDHEYATFLTPAQFEGQVDMDDEEDKQGRVIVAYVDLSKPDEPSLDGVEPVKYRKSLRPKLAHARKSSYWKRDFSITFQTGDGAGTDRLADYIEYRFTEWPAQVEPETVEGLTDGSGRTIVEALENLGEDAETMETLRGRVLEIDPDPPVLMTVRARVDENGDYLWPGEIDVFNDLLKYRKTADYRESKQHKGMSAGSGSATASGSGIDMVTGESSELVGMAEDPLNYYRVKQVECFPGMHIENSWLSHPVSAETALLIENSDDLVDGCGSSRGRFTVYHLPYLTGEMTADDARLLNAILTDIGNGVTDGSVLRHFYDQTPGEDGDEGYRRRLRFHTVVLDQYQNKRYRVYAEEPAAMAQPLFDLAEAHNAELRHGVFGGAGLPTAESTVSASDDDGAAFRLINTGMSEPDRVDGIATGQYLAETLPRFEDTSSRDPLPALMTAIHSDEQLSEDELLELYAERLAAEEREGEREAYFEEVAAEQYAQLRALSRAGLLNGTTYHDTMTEDTTDTSRTILADVDSDEISRVEKLDAFIEASPHFDGSDDRRAAFLLGALIGRLSRHQSNSRGVSHTIRQKYPVSRITVDRAREAFTEVIDLNNTYSDAEDIGGLMFEAYVTRLTDALGRQSIDEWSMEEATLKVDYGHGLAYGLTDNTKKNPENDD